MEAMRAKVSVIMPSLNVAAYIRECLDSVISQSLQELEIICIDAGSTDGTKEILTDYAKRDSRIVLLHSERKSYGRQVNMGLGSLLMKMEYPVYQFEYTQLFFVCSLR